MVRGREVPKMTPGRAALVGLMHRYLGGLLDPFVTLLEVHKLLYFMQVAGEPLRLKFEKYHYGPYAENLRHVLNDVEGHLVSGYIDGGDSPTKQLELVPGSIADANEFLAEHPDTLARFDRVSSLVQGFESPYGLELLATVHWVLVNYEFDSLDKVIACVHQWNDRKKSFTPRQIGLAAEILMMHGWIDEKSKFFQTKD